MRIGVFVVALVFLNTTEAQAAEFPVKDAKAAIAIAKRVCRDKADPSLKWEAIFDNTHHVWHADTWLSLKCTGTNPPLWYVEVPVNGPRPTECSQSLYTLICPAPQKPN